MAKKISWSKFRHYLPLSLIRKTNETELSIDLVNGSRIYLAGADNPDSLRGMTIDGVVLDEYAFMKREVWDGIIRPTLLTTNGWATFIGTPSGKNHFYELFKRGQEEDEKDWNSYKLGAPESGVISEEELEKIKKETTEEFYRQEYLCEFIDGAGQVFRRIKENTIAEGEDPIPGRNYVMGVDLGKAVDWTVITVIDRHTHKVVCIERFNKIDWEFQASRIESVCLRYNTAPIWLDSTGAGDPVADNLQRKGLPIRRFQYTNSKKKELIENLVLKFEYDKIKIIDFRPLIDELEIFTYEVSPRTRRIMYNAPVGYHDDCVNSLALACWKLGSKLLSPKRKFGPDLTTNDWDDDDSSEYEPENSITGY
jgi:phage FluMu gp28-like protein